MTLLLNGLSEDQQRELLAAGSLRSLKPRDVLGAQGEPAESIALVQVGHLKLGKLNADGAETLVRFIGPGDCYGAIALSPGKRFPVSAVAVEPSRVLVWPRLAIVGLAERIPQIRLNLHSFIRRARAGPAPGKVSLRGHHREHDSRRHRLGNPLERAHLPAPRDRFLLRRQDAPRRRVRRARRVFHRDRQDDRGVDRQRDARRAGLDPRTAATSWSTTSLRPTTSRSVRSCHGSSRWPRKSRECTARRRRTCAGSRRC
jgi:CRP-like cAMP-binding protein